MYLKTIGEKLIFIIGLITVPLIVAGICLGVGRFSLSLFDGIKILYSIINKRLADIPEDQRKKVLMIGHYSSTNFTLGGFSDYWTSVTGSIHVGKGTQGNVNMEQVYSWASDIMFISTLSDFFPEDFYNNTTVEGADWSGVPAVINKQVYKFPLGMHR